MRLYNIWSALHKCLQVLDHNRKEMGAVISPILWMRKSSILTCPRSQGLVHGGPQIQTRCSGSRVTLSASVQYKAHCNGTCFAVIDKGQFIQCQTVERVLSKGTRTLTYLRSLFSTQRYYELLQSKLVLTISLWSAKYRMSLPMFSQMENMRCREGKWLI